MSDKTKDDLRTNYSRTNFHQDHGTRGTQNHDNSEKVWEKAQLERQLKHQYRSDVQDFYFDSDHEANTDDHSSQDDDYQQDENLQLVNVSQNLEIKRNIKNRINKEIDLSRKQWESFAFDYYGLHQIFSSIHKNIRTTYEYMYKGKTLRIRPSEVKLFQKYVLLYPDERGAKEISEDGMLNFFWALKQGVIMSAMERSVIARKVRQGAETRKRNFDWKKRQNQEKNLKNDDNENDAEPLYASSDDYFVDHIQESLPDKEKNWEQKVKYFGKSR